MYNGTASVFDKDFRKARARAISKLSPTRRGTVAPNWAETVGRDLPELVDRGSIVGSPSPDGPLAIGFVQ